LKEGKSVKKYYKSITTAYKEAQLFQSITALEPDESCVFPPNVISLVVLVFAENRTPLILPTIMLTAPKGECLQG